MICDNYMIQNDNYPKEFSFYRRQVTLGESYLTDKYSHKLLGFTEQINGKIRVIQCYECYNEDTDEIDECNIILDSFKSIDEALKLAKEFFEIRD